MTSETNKKGNSKQEGSSSLRGNTETGMAARTLRACADSGHVSD